MRGNEHLTVQVNGPIMHCVLNRPEALNAFSDQMISGLMKALKEAEESEDVKAVVLSGAGRSFSAGGDVKGMGQASAAKLYDHVGKLNQLILAIKALPKPVIAVVHGYAAGAGFNLALACDQILAAEKSKFVMSFAQVGLISDGGGHYFLTKVLGPYRAKELLFRAEPINVEQAYDWGMVNRILPVDDLEGAAMEYALEIANGPARAIGMIKRVVDQADQSDLAAILEQERISQTMMIATEDHKEGVEAFKNKRKPEFAGR
ncbi:enoyl-CoA hydratase [Halobacillus sp. ACCC02827]|uniref:enoyl-CoA hydratase/isomerase family protein n=1 Tax=Bacillaceae TaxID=186817 RepID=UPI0002A4DBB6|nr:MULTISPECIES: enoyl-CoA hydratase [Bacillaceae]ELK48940.1 enoyl-CoA hydratase [Halobacillus sp. BAB-2008]QHT45734.1 enoyl-CoA hydratase [Bacillus sp. SB49]WJE16533.1 enoyl-CoA hydratase [Halobacillus sp. ACCC02827]